MGPAPLVAPVRSALSGAGFFLAKTMTSSTGNSLNCLLNPITQFGFRRKRRAPVADRWCAALRRRAQCALWPLHHHHDVARIRVIEEGARPLINHVGIKTVGFEQRHAPLPLIVFGFGLVKLSRQFRDLAIEVFLRLEAAIAGIGVDAEIADQQRRHYVETERRQKRSELWACDHDAMMDAIA